MKYLESFLPTNKEKKAFISSIIILVLGIVAEILFLIVFQEKSNRWKGWIIIVIGLLSPFLGLYLWNKYIPKYAPKVLHFLITNFFGRKILGGGSFAYYEYKPPEYKEGWISPLNRLIAVIIAYLGITVTIAKIIFSIIPFSPKTPLESIGALVFWILMMLLVPVIMTPITPIVWGLEDADVKVWNNGDKTNWRISKRYKARFNSLISLGAIIAGLSIGNESLIDKIVLFIQIIAIAFLIVIIPNTLIVLSYYSYFIKILNRLIKDSVQLETFETTLIPKEKEEIIKKPDILKKEAQTQSENKKIEKINKEELPPAGEKNLELEDNTRYESLPRKEKTDTLKESNNENPTEANSKQTETSSENNENNDH